MAGVATPHGPLVYFVGIASMASLIHPINRHISELKRRLLVIGGAVMLGFVVAFSFHRTL